MSSERLLLLLSIEVTGVLFLFVMFCIDLEPMTSILASYVVMVILMVIMIGLNGGGGFVNKADAIKSIELSISNVISGGVVLLLPYAALKYFGNEYSALISLALSLGVLLALVPRAMSYKYLPLISKGYEAGEDIFEIEAFKKFSLNVWRSVNITFLVMLCSVAPVSWIFPEVFFDGAVVLYLLMIFLIYSMQISFPSFCALQIAENTRLALLFNLFSLAMVVSVFVLLGFIGLKLVSVISSIIAIYFARHLLMGLWMRSYAY